MKYENPEACVQAMRTEFFNMALKMMTQMNRSVKVEELPKVLKFAKKVSSHCADIVRNDILIQNDEEACKFWNSVYHSTNE